MNEKEYFHRLGLIEEFIKQGLLKKAGEEIDKLYAFKPVRMEWFVLKAQYLMAKGEKPETVQNAVSGKIIITSKMRMREQYFDLGEQLALKRKDELDFRRRKQVKTKYDVQFGSSEADTSRMQVLRDRLNGLCCECWENELTYEKLRQMAGIFYELNMMTPYLIAGAYCKYIEPDGGFYMYQWVQKLSNNGYILEKLRSEEKSSFIVMASSEEDSRICMTVARLLSRMKKEVFYVDVALSLEAEQKIKIQDLLTTSIENAETKNGINIFVPVEIVHAGKDTYDNRDYLLYYITNKLCCRGNAVILCSGEMIDCMGNSPVLNKQIERLSEFEMPGFEGNMAWGRIGNYLSYISDIYMEDCYELVKRKSSKRFSLVIPARNSSETLRHTLRTCLEQRGRHDYEILLSDNSTDGNYQVYNLYRELADERLVYIKTPRELPLSKSFEYAFLHASGEYILSMGSDDGILPWALDALDEIIAKYPEEEIIQWDRGFYAWPGFNGGQEHQFIVPAAYEKGKFHAFYRENTEYLSMVLNSKQNMYLLPMLYINSCFKRGYMSRVLACTGRLWDGVCQDIYMGIVNVCINQRILNVHYPLTVAGMSRSSVGATSNLPIKTDEEFTESRRRQDVDSNVGGFCKSYIERMLPFTYTDTSSLYNSVLRAAARGLLPLEYLQKNPGWKSIFIQLAGELDWRDVAFDKKLHGLREAAAMQGQMFLKWFDETVYETLAEPGHIAAPNQNGEVKKKGYKDKVLDNGGVMLDASEYGVTNIYDAVKLFERLTKL